MRDRDVILRIVILALLLYSLASFASVRSDLRRTEQLAQSLEAELNELQCENRELEEMLSGPRSDEEMRMLARQRLGMVMPGEKVFYFTTDREEAIWAWK